MANSAMRASVRARLANVLVEAGCFSSILHMFERSDRSVAHLAERVACPGNISADARRAGALAHPTRRLVLRQIK